MPCLAISTLSAEQNSVRFWALLLAIANIGNATLGFMLELYVSGAAGAAAVVGGIAILTCGPKEPEQGAPMYKLAIILTAALIGANGIGVYFAYALLQFITSMVTMGLSVCCPMVHVGTPSPFEPETLLRAPHHSHRLLPSALPWSLVRSAVDRLRELRRRTARMRGHRWPGADFRPHDLLPLGHDGHRHPCGSRVPVQALQGPQESDDRPDLCRLQGFGVSARSPA